MRRRHALYYASLAEQLEQVRDTPEERAWLQMLEPERDNLRSVNTWALEHNEAEFAHRLNGSLFAFWGYRSNAAEALYWIDAVLALAAPNPSPAARRAEAMALNIAAYLAIALGDHSRGHDYFERALALFMANGDQSEIAAALRGCGYAAMQRGDLAKAQDYTGKSLAVSQAANDRSGIAWSLFDLGYLAFVRDALGEARVCLEDAVAALREQGNDYGLFRALFVLAHVMTMQGQGVHARSLFHEALRMQQQMRYVYTTADCLESFGGLEAAQGRPIQAVRLFAAAQAHREATGMHRWPYEIKVLQKLWKYRQPEIEGFEVA